MIGLGMWHIKPISMLSLGYSSYWGRRPCMVREMQGMDGGRHPRGGLSQEGHGQSNNDKCIHCNPIIKMGVAAYVDGLITRGA